MLPSQRREETPKLSIEHLKIYNYCHCYAQNLVEKGPRENNLSPRLYSLDLVRYLLLQLYHLTQPPSFLTYHHKSALRLFFLICVLICPPTLTSYTASLPTLPFSSAINLGAGAYLGATFSELAYSSRFLQSTPFH